MNKVYRTVWNEHTNTWVAVQETAKAHGKSASGSVHGIAVGLLERVGIKIPRFAASTMLLVLTATAGYAHAGPGIYINDGQDVNCTLLPDGSTAVPYAIQPGNPQQVSTPLQGVGSVSVYNAADVGLTSSYNPCNSRTTAGSEAHDKQTNRTLFYGDKNHTASETENGAKNLTLGGRLDVNSGIIGLGDRGTNGTNATNSIRIGTGVTLDDANKQTNSIAIGVDTKATVLDAVSIGAGAEASDTHGVGKVTAIGYSAKATDAHATALGAFSNAATDGSVAVGFESKSKGVGSVAMGHGSVSGSSGVDYTTAVGFQSQAGGYGAIAVGSGAQATVQDAAAFGHDSRATLKNSVALGNGSTTAVNAQGVESATIGSVTYGGGANKFAGSTNIAAGDQVSIGSAGNERQIKHVAAGAITASSTDAINGSQLFYVAQGLQNQIGSLGFGVNADNNSLKTHQLGKELAIVAGNTTETTSTNNLKTDVTQDAGTGKTTVTVSMKEAPTFTSVTTTDAAGNQTVTDGGGVTITPAAGGGNPVSLTTGGLNNGGNKITNVAAGTDPNDAVNLSQLQAMGSAAKTHYYSVNSNQQAAGSNYNNDGATGTDALAAGVKAQAAQRNSIAIGNEAKVENSPANPSSSSIAIGDKAKAQGDLALAIGPGATVSGENAAGGIAIGSAATSNNGGMAVGSGANAGNGTPMIPGLPVRLNNNVALGDSAKVKDDTNFRVALGSFSIAGESDLTAAPYKPTANANVAGIAGSGVELGEVSVGGDNTAGMGKTLYRRITNVAAGAADTDAVNVSQLKAAQAAATSKVAAGNGISVTPNVDATTGSTTYTVAADTTALNVGDGNNGNPAGKVITPTGADANKLATAGDIANAINNSGFNITAGGNTVGNTPVATTAKPGSTLTLKAGDGLTVKQDLDANGNQSYTYALNAQSVVQNAQTPVVYTKADGSKVYKHTDGKFYDAPNGAGNQVPVGDVIASMQDAAGNTTDPTTLANVKSNLADATAATTNPANNDRATLAAGNKGNNAATVNDVLNAGFTVQGNGQNKDFVTHGDTINFADGQGTVAKVTSAGGVTKVQFDTPMTYVDPAGNPTSTPSNKVNLVGDAAGGPVTLGNVADGTVAANSKEAINGGQLHDLKENGFKISDGTNTDTVKLTETVKYTGDGNIVTTVTDNQVGFKLADSITVGPATGGHPVNIDGNAGTVTGLTNKTWNPASITSGRAATEDQLKAAQAAASNKVTAGDGITVTDIANTDGSTTYKVAADTTALNVGDGNNGNPAGKVITPTGADANKLATAGDIANAINNSGFNITAGGNTVGNTPVATTAKPGSTLTLKAGDGLTVKQDLDANGNQSYTYALNAQSVVQNAQTPVVYTKADGSKVYKHTDGKFYDAPNGAGNQVPVGDVIASMQDAAGNTTDPTTLANVKSNLADATAATTNPANNDRATLAAGNKGNNAATVNDVLNAGFTVQGNGQNKDFVTHGDTINFADGQGTVAKVTSAGGVTKVQFDTPMTYVDPAGNPTSTPSNKVNLVGDAAGGPVTLGNVAPGTLSATSTEAVNGSQLYATNQNVAKGINFGGTTGSNNYQLGDTINVKGDNNITSTTVTGGAQLALNPNLNVTSVTTTDAAGNQTVTNGGGVTITPAGGGNPVSLTTGGLDNGGNKITNVADGTAGTDAVNVSQLNAALGALHGAGNANIAALDAKINDVADTANAGVAQAIATAGLPQAYLPGKNMVAVGGGYYKGETGYAVGFSTISDSGNWIIKATGSGNSRGNFGASIGAGYQW